MGYKFISISENKKVTYCGVQVIETVIVFLKNYFW